MRRKFEDLRENIEEFAEQDEYPMLVVRCLDVELAYVLTFFQALEQTRPADYMLAFPQPFVSPEGYLDGVAESLGLQVEAAGPIREEAGLPPFPPLPEEILDPRWRPEERLFATLQYLRSLLPNEREHKALVGLLPLECHDWEGFVALIRSVMPVHEIPPWMDALRIVTYDDREQRLLTSAMEADDVDKVLTFEIDFSTPALTDQLTHDASDPTVPVMERMACLLQLAALDYSHKRYADAIEKYGVLYTFYESHQLPSMQALCLLGVGDVLRATERYQQAKEKLQQGIAMAMESNTLPVLLNLLISIVEVCFELEHYQDAESYADSGAQVAAGVLNPFVYCDMHERRGDAQIAQEKLADGLASYAKCEELCEKYQYTTRWASVLETKIRLFDEARMRQRQRKAEDRLLMVRELERRGGAADDAADGSRG